MDKANTFRCSFSLPRELATDIAHVAKRMGVTQSAMLAELLSGPIGDLRRLVDLVPEDTSTVSTETAKRLRGASADVVANRVAEAIRQIAGSGS